MKHDYDILIIDDEQVVVDSVIKLCSAEDLTVDYSYDAPTALEKLQKTHYRLIICDIMMPDLDGFQFLSQVHQKKITTPVIMTTGFSTVENAVKSLYTGAIDFLPKPFSVEELNSVVMRGLKYAKINKFATSKDTDLKMVDSDLEYVPCPPKYHRIGYISWAFLEEIGVVKIGVTDFFLHTIENPIQIDCAHVDEEIIQGNSCAHIQTDDEMIHQIMAPLTGRIIERNEAVLNNYNIIMKDPYFKGWLYTIIPSDLDFELKHLTHCSSDR